MSAIDTAGGSTDPGEFINYESVSRPLPLLLRMFEGLNTGDFEIKRTSDGITYNNAGSNITNCNTTTAPYCNDDSDPLYARIAGSLANNGCMVFIGPRGKTYADVDYWEVCFRRAYNNGTVITGGTVNSVYLMVYVSCNGGWNNIASALTMPSPRVTDDPILRLDTNTFGIEGVAALNGFVTLSETTAPGAGFTMHNKGGDALYFSFRIDWVQHDTLDRFSADPSKRDLYHPIISVERGENTTCNCDSLVDATLIDTIGATQPIGACSRFGDGKTTMLTSSPWGLIGFLPTSGRTIATRLGKNTVSGNEPLNPFMYSRSGGLGSSRGSGQKGIGTHFWAAGEKHVFGDTPYVTSPGDRPYYCAGDLVFRNAGKKIYR